MRSFSGQCRDSKLLFRRSRRSKEATGRESHSLAWSVGCQKEHRGATLRSSLEIRPRLCTAGILEQLRRASERGRATTAGVIDVHCFCGPASDCITSEVHPRWRHRYSMEIRSRHGYLPECGDLTSISHAGAEDCGDSTRKRTQ